MAVQAYNFHWRVLLIDGQFTEIVAREVTSTRMGIRFGDPAGTVLCLPAEVVLMIERIDRNHLPFPVSDRDMVAMYERGRRPVGAAPGPPSEAAPFTLVRKPEV